MRGLSSKKSWPRVLSPLRGGRRRRRGDRRSDSGAFVPLVVPDSVAEHLDISPEELDDATRAAAIDQVDAAPEAGRVTEEEAERLKERNESGEVPGSGLPFWAHADNGPGFEFRFEFGHRGHSAAPRSRRRPTISA